MEPAPRIVFLRRVHPRTGRSGWARTDWPEADALGPMAVAHDCLEHEPCRPPSRSPLEDELLALGAMSWLRGLGGYWRGHAQPDPAWHLGRDLATLVRHRGALAEPLGQAPVSGGQAPARGGQARAPSEPAEPLTHQALRPLFQAGWSEARRRLPQVEGLARFERRATGWLHAGALRSARRWQRPPEQVAGLFCRFQCAVASYGESALGDRLIVGLGPGLAFSLTHEPARLLTHEPARLQERSA